MNKLLIIVLIVLVCGCIYKAGQPREEKLVRIDGVDKIVMHEPHRYSFLVDGKFQTYTIWSGRADCVEFVKLIDGEKPWVEAHYESKFLDGWKCCWMIIHANPSNINGGGWDHGKFGKGQTVVIEQGD